MKQENTLNQQVQSISGLLEDAFWNIEADARLIVSTPDIFNTQTLYLFGSGDSYNAALGATQAFAQYAGMQVQSLTALQASRYTAPYLPAPTGRVLAIGISNSGEAARTVEAMQAFAKAGARTLALTGALQSRMALAANQVWQVSAPPFASAPGVRGYALAQTALYLLAIRFGEVKGRITMEEAGALRKELYALCESSKEALNTFESTVRRFATLCGEKARIEFLASGPVRAAADFAVAKTIEAVGFTASSQDVEEFAHINFFQNSPEDIPTVLFAPETARSHSRNQEIAQQLRLMGRPLLLVTTGNKAFGEFGEDVVRLPQEIPEAFFPLFASCVAAGLIAHIPLVQGNTYFRGHQGPWAEEGIFTIRTSRIETGEANHADN